MCCLIEEAKSNCKMEVETGLVSIGLLAGGSSIDEFEGSILESPLLFVEVVAWVEVAGHGVGIAAFGFESFRWEDCQER